MGDVQYGLWTEVEPRKVVLMEDLVGQGVSAGVSYPSVVFEDDDPSYIVVNGIH